MTLMNRLFGDWTTQPYANRECNLAGMERLQFTDLLDHFSKDLFDARTGKGTLILYNPGALEARPGLDVLALGKTWDAARRGVEVEFPAGVKNLLAARAG